MYSYIVYELYFFYRPDHNRIKEVGVERACAEWLLRCGAHVRWVGSDRFHTDYNTLPAGKGKGYQIQEINADEAAVMDIGFEHLGESLIWTLTGRILGLRPANERRRYFVTTSLIGWAQT